MIQISIDVMLDDPSLCIVQIYTQTTSQAVFALLSDGSLAVLYPNENNTLVMASKTLAANHLPVDILRKIVTTDEGQVQVPITALACHPFVENLVVVGFKDGSFTIWFPTDPEPSYKAELHQVEICLIKWLSYGRILVTCDTSGQCILYKFSTDTYSFESITKTRKTGHVVDIVERSCCTENIMYSIEQEHGTHLIDISNYAGAGLFECVVMWSKGDVAVLTDSGVIRHIGSINLANDSVILYKLYYWSCSDTCCVISTAGDVFLFGFKTLAVGAYKDVITKSRIEYKKEHGIVQFPGTRIAYIAPSDGQLRILDLLAQEVAFVDIEDCIENYAGVNGSLAIIRDFGILIPLRGKNGYAVVSCHRNLNFQGSNCNKPIHTHASSEHYLHANDMRFSDSLSLDAGASASGAQDEFTVTEQHFLHTENQRCGYSNVFITQVLVGDNSLSQIMITNYAVSNRNIVSNEKIPIFYDEDSNPISLVSGYAPETASTPKGVSDDAIDAFSTEVILTRSKFVSLLLFSFEPKDMQVTYANNTNSSIMAQDLTGEGLTHTAFLDQKFTDSRNSFISAVLVGARTIKVSINTEENVLQEHSLKITHAVKKISALTNPTTSVAQNNLCGFVLTFGDNTFTVFEVSIGKVPRLAGSFRLDERYTYVADCVLFGRYILTSQNSRSDLESDYTKVEIVKYSITGSKAASLVLSDDPIHGSTVERIARMTLVNQHLFMINNNLSLFYTDCKSFSSMVKVIDIAKVLFSTDIYRAYPKADSDGDDASGLPRHFRNSAKQHTTQQARDEAKLKDIMQVDNAMQVNQELAKKLKREEKEQSAISVRSTLSSLIPLDTICVQSCNATLTLDNAHHILFSMIFKGYNVVTGLPCLLPYVAALNIDSKILGEVLANAQTGTSANSDKTQETTDNTTGSVAVLNSRIFDFAPYTVTNVAPDCFGNIGVELVLSTSLNLLFIGSSMLFSLKLGVFEKRMLSSQNLTTYLNWLEEQNSSLNAREDSMEKAEEQIALLQSLCATQDQCARILLLVRSFTETAITTADRIRGSWFDFNDKIFLSIQGVFAPYSSSKFEKLVEPLSSTMLTLLSPTFVFSERNGKSDKVRTSSFITINSDRLTVKNLTALGSSNKVGFKQSCTATYALNKFTICSTNGHLAEAYSHVVISENLQVWRSLATLCIQNGYVNLLKTCITHLKSPMLSLLMRLTITHEKSSATPFGEFGDIELGTTLSSRDNLLLSLLSISLGACGQGIDKVKDKPLLLSSVLADIGMSIQALMPDSPYSIAQSTGGMTSLAKKASILALANRLVHLNDTSSADICYSEIYKSGAVHANEIDSLNANPQLILNSSDNIKALRAEYDAKGIDAFLVLAKKVTDTQSIYVAARIIESEAKKDAQKDSSKVDAAKQGALWLEAARLYKRCSAFTHAMNCALKCKDDELIYSLGTVSQNRRMSLVAATYFANKYKAGLTILSEKGSDRPSEDFYDELQTCIEHALILYKSAGLGAQSIELCIKSNRMKELANLLDDTFCEPAKTVDQGMDEDEGNTGSSSAATATATAAAHTGTDTCDEKGQEISSDLLLRAGKALLDVSPDDYSLNDYNSFIRIAVVALAKASAYKEALQAILDGKIQISERIADILTPTMVDNNEDAKKVTETLGKLLHKAGLYQSAVKKFILAQNHVLAMNSLIKQGDPTKVIKFANMAKQKQVYISAANFLQTLNWRSNPTYMKAIITFYEKSNFLETIAKFFANCAVEEISEYHDYVKAKQAIIEAMKRQKVAIEYVEQGASSKESEKVAAARAAKVASLKETLQLYEQNGKLVHAFLQLCDFARDTSQAHDSAETLKTNSSKLLTAVRQMDNCYVKVGDILGLLAEFHGVRGEKGRIVSIIKDMVKEGLDPAKYLDAELYAMHAAEAGVAVDNGAVELEGIDLGGEKSDA